MVASQRWQLKMVWLLQGFVPLQSLKIFNEVHKEKEKQRILTNERLQLKMYERSQLID